MGDGPAAHAAGGEVTPNATPTPIFSRAAIGDGIRGDVLIGEESDDEPDHDKPHHGDEPDHKAGP